MDGGRNASPMRSEITVDGTPISYLSAGDGPLVLLLHGTYWSRVWQPVLPVLAEHGVRAVAVDLPGAGRSGGQLTLETGNVPALAAWVERFADALGAGDELLVAGHDIGGAITQHLAVHSRRAVPRFALVNSVSYDSWPVPGVKRFRDPEVAAAVSVEELLSWREQAITAAIGRPFVNGDR
jgi:pimeloyl-ACP methyl ester carboxylesterase